MRDAYYGFPGGRPVWPFARAGLLVSNMQIRWALLTLGEPVDA